VSSSSRGLWGGDALLENPNHSRSRFGARWGPRFASVQFESPASRPSRLSMAGPALARRVARPPHLTAMKKLRIVR
jgi:hypothetical protein